MKRVTRNIAGGLALSLTAHLGLTTNGHAAKEFAEIRTASNRNPAAVSDSPSFTSRLRSLSELQQRVVEGDKSALTEQLTLARAIAKDLERNPADQWRNLRDLRALTKYVLSGGDPTILSRLLNSPTFPEQELSLARGVVAYSHGDRGQAAKWLGQVEHRHLGPSLGGHVALVKAVITVHSSPADALKLCQEAILHSPGTHIEEAALRLSISIGISSGDMASVTRSHTRHLLRFPNSLYASDIDIQVARAVAENPGISAAQFDMADRLAVLIPPSRRRAFFAQLAEASLRAGQFTAAIQAARLALLPPTSPPASDAESTAALLAIQGAALILTADRKEGLSRLIEARGAEPSAATADLIATAESLIAMIKAPPVQSAATPDATITPSNEQVPPPPSIGTAKHTEASTRGQTQFEAVRTRAMEALASADQLIEQSKK